VGSKILDNSLPARIIFFSKYTEWGFDHSSCPTDREFEFSKSQIPTYPPPLPRMGVVRLNIDRCI